MIHQVSATSVLPRDEPDSGHLLDFQHAPNQGAISTNHHTHTQMEIVKLEVPWIDVHTLVVL